MSTKGQIQKNEQRIKKKMAAIQVKLLFPLHNIT